MVGDGSYFQEGKLIHNIMVYIYICFFNFKMDDFGSWSFPETLTSVAPRFAMDAQVAVQWEQSPIDLKTWKSTVFWWASLAIECINSSRFQQALGNRILWWDVFVTLVFCAPFWDIFVNPWKENFTTIIIHSTW